MKKTMLLLLLAVVLLTTGCIAEEPSMGEYAPKIDPGDFVSDVTNRYFTLTPKKNFVYEGETEEGTERIEVYTTNETRNIMGVRTTVVWDRVWLNGELIEDTKDWYAQDKEGNVWYFGEDSKELVNGKIVSRAGSWKAGVDGAKPGIIMKASPLVGDSYRQEYYKGEAEDMGDVIALGETVAVPYGTFTDCLKTRDWTQLNPGADEHKYYCPEIGRVVLEVSLESGKKVQLVEIAAEIQQIEEIAEEFQAQITEEDAKRIALNEVPGRVTGVAIEKKFGKAAYVVEIAADAGPETDVMVDTETGEVLGIEK